jgi:membrane protein involved in colicin uptake
MLEHGKGTAVQNDREEEAERRAEEAAERAEEAARRAEEAAKRAEEAERRAEKAAPSEEEPPSGATYGGEPDSAQPTRGWGSDTPGD